MKQTGAEILAAGAGAAGAAAPGAEIEAAVEFEAVDQKIDLDRLGFFQEILVDEELKSVDVEHFVVVSWLVQSHGEAGAASPALVEKYADRRDFFAPEIGLNLFSGRRGDFNHGFLLVGTINGLPFETDHLMPSLNFRQR
jgi:hypothetical protein